MLQRCQREIEIMGRERETWLLVLQVAVGKCAWSMNEARRGRENQEWKGPIKSGLEKANMNMSVRWKIMSMPKETKWEKANMSVKIEGRKTNAKRCELRMRRGKERFACECSSRRYRVVVQQVGGAGQRKEGKKVPGSSAQVGPLIVQKTIPIDRRLRRPHPTPKHPSHHLLPLPLHCPLPHIPHPQRDLPPGAHHQLVLVHARLVRGDA